MPFFDELQTFAFFHQQQLICVAVGNANPHSKLSQIQHWIQKNSL